jgi:hypothetical protein
MTLSYEQMSIMEDAPSRVSFVKSVSLKKTSETEVFIGHEDMVVELLDGRIQVHRDISCCSESIRASGKFQKGRRKKTTAKRY